MERIARQLSLLMLKKLNGKETHMTIIKLSDPIVGDRSPGQVITIDMILRHIVHTKRITGCEHLMLEAI